MTKWEKEPCLSCPVALAKNTTVTELLIALETCKACDKAEQGGGAE